MASLRQRPLLRLAWLLRIASSGPYTMLLGRSPVARMSIRTGSAADLVGCRASRKALLTANEEYSEATLPRVSGKIPG